MIAHPAQGVRTPLVKRRCIDLGRYRSALCPRTAA